MFRTFSFFLSNMLSDKPQMLSKFESLTNEILIECLGYLNAFDIFHSFDELNDRFSNLICNVPLHLDFHDIQKSVSDQFCRKILVNPELINQIYSIRLLNEDECFQCNLFFSSFSLEEFSRLRRFAALLPSVAPPWYWQSFQLQTYLTIKLADLLFSQVRILSIICLDELSIEIDRTSSITQLTTLYCNAKHFHYLIKHLSLLQYLHIKYRLLFSSDDINVRSNSECAIHLK